LGQFVKNKRLWFSLIFSLSVHFFLLINVVDSSWSIKSQLIDHYPTLVVSLSTLSPEKLLPEKLPSKKIANNQAPLPLSVQRVERRIFRKKQQEHKPVTQKQVSPSSTPLPSDQKSEQRILRPDYSVNHLGNAGMNKALVLDDNAKHEIQKKRLISTPGAATLIARSIATVRNDPNLGVEEERDFSRYLLKKQLESMNRLLPALTESTFSLKGEIDEFKTASGDTVLTMHLGNGKKVCVSISVHDFSTVDIAENPAAWVLVAC